jgi:hypothetical protein
MLAPRRALEITPWYYKHMQSTRPLLQDSRYEAPGARSTKLSDIKIRLDILPCCIHVYRFLLGYTK